MSNTKNIILEGKNFVVSGVFSIPRGDIQDRITKNGGNIQSGISTKTDYLLAGAVSYTHLRAHETKGNLVCRLLLEKKNFFNDTATTEIYTILFVGSVRCV